MHDQFRINFVHLPTPFNHKAQVVESDPDLEELLYQQGTQVWCSNGVLIWIWWTFELDSIGKLFYKFQRHNSARQKRGAPGHMSVDHIIINISCYSKCVCDTASF